MTDDQKRVAVAFFRTNSGREPVREWLKELDADDRQIVGNDLQTLEYGWPIGMPLCRSFKSHKGLWEVRSNLSSGRIARVLFCVNRGRMVLLHAFIKKTQKTPMRELDVAVRRMKGEGDD
ncbi:MAG: type II toxin-antitoxin system RelE/ParE family toxin [Gammaproteobacteria bacterium]|jgi:phage-related protein|nr:type II toxin-antitoxin system RelE/ParE family toxin [Gammaproteobacteria bacterium]